MPKFTEASLEELFSRYAQDDPEVFPAIYEQIAPGLERYLASRLRSKEAIGEVMQEVFLRLHQYRYRYNSKHLAWQWVFVVARTQLRLCYQKQGVRAQEVEFLPELSQEDSVSTNMDRGRLDLEEVEAQVDPETFLLLKRKYIEEYSYREIAEELGLDEANLRQRLSRSLRRLRQSLRGREDERAEDN